MCVIGSYRCVSLKERGSRQRSSVPESDLGLISIIIISAGRARRPLPSCSGQYMHARVPSCRYRCAYRVLSAREPTFRGRRRSPDSSAGRRSARRERAAKKRSLCWKRIYLSLSLSLSHSFRGRPFDAAATIA